MAHRSSSREALPEVALRLRRWIAPSLLAWYNAHRRDLPWRQSRDPYRIWVSEIMLQQTQVATVIPYFHRFLERFPTLVDLAEADEQEVLRLWEGLGYYRRARHLLQAARLLHTHHGGTLPADAAILSTLPGLGEYTRNAILSQAFDLPFPILEANTIRLLSRLFGREDDPRQSAARRWLWQAAEALLPDEQIGDFNQALMELGALVCTPEKPACAGCPLSHHCVARQSGTPEAYPRRAAPAPATEVREVALVIRREASVLFVQRPADATRWANLWEFPHTEVGAEESLEAAARRLAREQCGLNVRLGAELTTLRHGVTRFRITLSCFEADWDGGEFASPVYSRGEWLTPGELGSHPVSSPQRRLTRLVASTRQRRLF